MKFPGTPLTQVKSFAKVSTLPTPNKSVHKSVDAQVQPKVSVGYGCGRLGWREPEQLIPCLRNGKGRKSLRLPLIDQRLQVPLVFKLNNGPS